MKILNKSIIGILIIIGIVKTSISSFAQTFQWAKTIAGSGYGEGKSIIIDSSGNIFTTGSFGGTADFDPGIGVSNFNSMGDWDIFIQKMDSNGNFLWARTFGGADWDQAYSSAVDAAGNIYTTGRFTGLVDFDPGSGVFSLSSSGNSDIFVQKMDASGNFLWAKSIGGINAESVQSITVDTAENVYTTGHFTETIDFDPGPQSDFHTAMDNSHIFIQKLNKDGNFIWAKTFGGTFASGGNSITFDLSGNVYTAGILQGTVDFDPGIGITNLTSEGSQDVFIQKLDPDGNFLWAKSFGGIGADQVRSLKIDNSGNIISTGSFSSITDFDPGTGIANFTPEGVDDIYVSKLDPSGLFLWAKTFGGFSFDVGNSVCIDAQDNIYTIGNFVGTVDFDPGLNIVNHSSAGYEDIFIHKMDAQGNFMWAKTFGGTDSEYGQSITMDTLDNIYTTGTFYGTPDFNTEAGVYNISSGGQADIFIQKIGICIPPNVTVTDNGDATITASSVTGTDYEWLNCATGNTVGTSQIFTATENGSYQVVVSNGMCDDTSACVTIDYIGIQEIASIDVQLIPNPTFDFVTIQMTTPLVIIEVRNIHGDLVITKEMTAGQVVDLSKVEAGVYFFTIRTTNDAVVRRVLKN